MSETTDRRMTLVTSEDDALFVEIEAAVAHVVLDRPKVINALNDAMKSTLAEALPQLSRDPKLYAVVIRSATDRGFCAGGDVRELTALGRSDLAAAKRSLAQEYRLNWQLECFYKPTAALIDGMMMGSGVGLTMYSTHRVAGDNYVFAMPETAVGLFPDVGVAHRLAALPDEVGMYLGLTGRSIGRADAYALGLVTHCIPVARYSEVIAELADAQTIDPTLDSRHQDPGRAPISSYRSVIAEVFSAPTVEEIIERLERKARQPSEFDEWSRAVLTDLQARSPTSLKVTLRHIRESASRDLRQTLMADYRLGCRFLEAFDFYEGVRALLIDKDGRPKWQPSKLKDVSNAEIDAYFAPLGEEELELPTKDYVTVDQ
ncbi:MAG: enoyl-CoA hydratase/isomerase family protein [Hyphomicrobiaceae bacterium]